MNKLAITIATLAALSTAAFAEGQQEGYVTGSTMTESRAIFADEQTSSEGKSSSEQFESEGGRDGHGGRAGAGGSI